MIEVPSERMTIAASLGPEYSLLDLESAAQHPSCYARPHMMSPRIAISAPSAALTVSLLNNPPPQSHWNDELCDPRLASLNIGYWTSVHIPDHLAALLISTHRRADHPVYGLFDPDLLIEDLCNTDYASVRHS